MDVQDLSKSYSGDIIILQAYLPLFFMSLVHTVTVMI